MGTRQEMTRNEAGKSSGQVSAGGDLPVRRQTQRAGNIGRRLCGADGRTRSLPEFSCASLCRFGRTRRHAEVPPAFVSAPLKARSGRSLSGHRLCRCGRTSSLHGFRRTSLCRAQGTDMPQRSAERAEFQGDPTVRLRTDGSSPWGLLLTSLFFMLLATFVFLLGTSRDGSQSQPYGTARRFARVTLVLRRAAKARSSTGCRRLNRRVIAAENDSAGLTRVALRHSGCA